MTKRGERIRAEQRKRAAAKHLPTFGEVVEKRGEIDRLRTSIQDLNQRAPLVAREEARVKLKVVSCDACDAPKGCCKVATVIFLHEAVPVVATLKAEGRDTPELRAALLAAAEKMEQTTRRLYVSPCVFLDGQERCTVYDVRPRVCGTTLAFSAPDQCSNWEHGSIDRFDDGFYEKAAWKLAWEFHKRLGLRSHEPDAVIGMLPRMVLVCLEAWDRTDYQESLSVGDWGPRAFRAIGLPFPAQRTP